MKEAVIAGYLRTGWSRSRAGDPSRDWLGHLSTQDLFSRLLPETYADGNIIEVNAISSSVRAGVSEKTPWADGIPCSRRTYPRRSPRNLWTSKADLLWPPFTLAPWGYRPERRNRYGRRDGAPHPRSEGVTLVQKGAISPYMPFTG